MLRYDGTSVGSPISIQNIMPGMLRPTEGTYIGPDPLLIENSNMWNCEIQILVQYYYQK